MQLFRLSGQQAIQVQRLSTLAEVEPNADGMSQELARDLIGQMPGVAREHEVIMQPIWLIT